MIVNSSRGPLNWSEYDSAFVRIEAKLPVGGMAVGRIQTSSETALVGLSALLLGTDAYSLRPSNVTALSADSANSSPGAPRIGWFWYWPGFAPAADESSMLLPANSSSLQYAAGLSLL